MAQDKLNNDIDNHIQFFLGVKTGLANYTLSGEEVALRTDRGASLINRKGIEIGGILRVQFYKFFYTKAELNYLQKGGHLRGGGWVYQDPVKVNYLHVPFLLGITPIRTEHLWISLEGGWAYNSLTSSENTYSKDLTENYYATENTGLNSKVLGGEIAMITSPKTLFFLNFRHTKDTNYFHARVYRPSGFRFDLWNKGNSLTVGMIFKVN